MMKQEFIQLAQEVKMPLLNNTVDDGDYEILENAYYVIYFITHPLHFHSRLDILMCRHGAFGYGLHIFKFFDQVVNGAYHAHDGAGHLIL